MNDKVDKMNECSNYKITDGLAQARSKTKESNEYNLFDYPSYSSSLLEKSAPEIRLKGSRCGTRPTGLKQDSIGWITDRR